MLTQIDDDGREFVVVYANWSNNKTKAKYSSYEGECLVVWAIFSFICYLYGSPFTLVIDHQPLKFLMELDRLTSKLAKRAFILQEYNFDIIHRAYKVNQDVDGLSQNPNSNEEDTTSVRWHGKVDLEAMPGRHAYAYMCILLGCFGDVPQGNIGGGNSQIDDDALEGNIVLDIHLDLPIMANLQQVGFWWD